MTEYKCTVCSSDEDGDFKFFVAYDKTIGEVSYMDDAHATRCPRCGTLTATEDVKKL